MVVPQIVVAMISPSVGSRAYSWGRRPLLICGFTALILRGISFAFIRDPELLLVAQLLDGIAAAVFGVLVPLIVADVTFGTGHFNLAQGIVGTATGIGASLSTFFAGYITDRFNDQVAFLALAGIAALALAVVALAMPETREPLPASRRQVALLPK